jgi:tetratricopeptide (TPR) repeat protein
MRKVEPASIHFAWFVFVFAGALLFAQPQQTTSAVSSIEQLVRSHEYGQALQLIQSGLNRSPDDFRLWTLEGIVFSMQGNPSGAIGAFNKALTLSPHYSPALKGEVQLFYSTGDKRAVPLLERIIQTDPHDATAHEMLAMLEQKQGNCQAANEEFLLSASSIDGHPASLAAYGYCLVHLERTRDAIPIFERLTALLPDQSYPKYDLAMVLMTAKQNDAALKVLDPLLTPDQQDPDILSLASEAYEAAGETPKAVALLRQAIVLSPTTASYYVSFASICFDHDSFQVGIDMIDAGLKYIPNDSSLYISRGLLYAQLAQYDRAEADFNKAEQLDSAHSLGSYAGDLAELARNNPDEALTRVRSQLKVHPDSPLLHYMLAELIMQQAPAAGSPAFREALRSAQAAIKLQPDLVSARDLLANIYIHSEQYDLAAEQCRIALKNSPSDETAAYHLLIALRHSGPNNTEEMKALVKRISDMHQASMHQEADRKRYRLVEQDQPPAQ